MSPTPAEHRPQDTDAPVASPPVGTAAVETVADAGSAKKNYTKPQGRYPVPSYTPYNQGYYYPNAPGFGYPQPYYGGAPAPGAYPSYHAPKVTIKSKDGQTVHFPNAGASAAAPVAVASEGDAAADTAVAPAAPAAPVDEVKNTFLEQFKKQLAEKKRLKEEAEAAKKAEAAAIEAKKAEEAAAIEAKKAEEAAAVEAKKAEEAAAKKAEEAAAEAAKLEAAKAEAEALQLAEAEAKKATQAAEGFTSPPQTIPEEPLASLDGALKTETEGTAAVEGTGLDDVPAEAVVDASAFGITSFFERLATANVIPDPFTHPYPTGISSPDPNLLSVPTGKTHRYDPHFLFQFQEVINFPIDQAWKDKYSQLIVIPVGRGASSSADHSFSRNNSRFSQPNLPMRHSSNNLRGQQFDLSSRQNSRTNSKRKPNNRDRDQNRSMRNTRGSRREEEDQPRVEISSEPVKPLEKTANRWVPKSRATKTEVKYAPDGVTELVEGKELGSKIKSLLNKLTLEKFESISDEILVVANQSQWEEEATSLKHVVELIFAKATDEPHWSSMYAKLIAKMCTVVGDEIKDVTVVNKEGTALCGGQLVRKCLLSRCQSEYEKGWSDKLPTNEDGTPIEPELLSDEYYAMAAAKRRGLGLVKFIGELYILGLLSDKIVFVCLDGQSKNVVDPSEDTLENLAQLLQTVGKRLETTNNVNVLNTVFDRVATIIEQVAIPSRIRFMLMDLQDLRRAKWSGVNDNKGPKTIQEIHDDAERKKAEDERAKDKRRRQPESRQNSRQTSSWGQTNRVSQTDLKNFGVVRNSERSGPMNSFSKSRSSRDSKRVEKEETALVGGTPVATRENSKRVEPVAQNMFAALAEAEAEAEAAAEAHEAEVAAEAAAAAAAEAAADAHEAEPVQEA